MFESHIERWALEVDGEPLITPRAHLLPVRFRGRAAMLKVATYPAEIVGNAVMEWWGGARSDGVVATGAARVLAVEGAAVVMERAVEPGTLVRLLDQGRTDDAIEIIIDIAEALHAQRLTSPPSDLPPLERWFAVLPAAADQYGGAMHACAAAAADLLRSQADLVVLHGDLHHENVLDFGSSGWLAIDPKGVRGERSFDYVHHIFDPDDPNVPDLAALEQRLAFTARLTRSDQSRLRRWLLAWSGLAAAWWLDHGSSADPALAVAAMLAAEESG